MTIMEIAEHARKLALTDGGHTPTLLVEGSLNKAMCEISDLSRDHKDKCRRFLKAGVSLVKENMIGQLRPVFFLCEAWLPITDEGAK